MHYKQYGNKDLKVSAIGFGCMRFPDEDILGNRYDKCADLVKHAYEKGINYFDTAPEYCFDKSEEVLGLAVKELPRNKIYISSKTNFGEIDNPPTKDGFFKRLEQTLTRLNTGYLDFYHLWCLLSIKSYEKQFGVMQEWFEDAKRQGLIRNIVFSSHMPSEDLNKIINTNNFDGMLVGYNALNYVYRQGGIREAHKNGMGVVVMNPMGGGVIPKNPERFGYLTEGTNLNVSQSAVRFVASHKEVTVTLVGFSSSYQIDDAVLAVENLKEYPADEVIKMFNTGGAFNNLCTSCGYCDYCPSGIPIPKYMDIYNEKILNGSMEEHFINWNISSEYAKKCTKCEKCEKLCTQHLPIIERLEYIAQNY